jgi:hypothetical protein
MTTKLLAAFSVFALSAVTFAQVGISTSNPQASFHIDAAKDNPASGVPLCNTTSQ